MAITLVQHVTGYATSAASNTVVTCTGVVAGSTLIVITSNGANTRTFTVTSDLDGTFLGADGNSSWGVQPPGASGSYTYGWKLTNVTGGTHSVTIDQSSTYLAYYYKVIEVQGSDGTVSTDSKTYQDSAGPYECATTGWDVVAGDAMITAGKLSAARVPWTVTGYTHEIASNNTAGVNYRVFAGDVSSEKCAWSSNNGQATDDAACLAMKFTAAAGGQPRFVRNLTHIYPPARGRMGAWF